MGEFANPLAVAAWVEQAELGRSGRTDISRDMIVVGDMNAKEVYVYVKPSAGWWHL